LLQSPAIKATIATMAHIAIWLGRSCAWPTSTSTAGASSSA
jgi:hypothetical protein